MLIPILLLLQQPADGVQRFQAFSRNNAAFSVKVGIHSEGLIYDGVGTLQVLRPSSIRLVMNWGPYDYNYVGAQNRGLEFERYARIYQVYPSGGQLVPVESMYSNLQPESVPFVLIFGDLARFLPQGSSFKLASSKDGNETYEADWGGQTGNGKLSATIGKDGRLLRFEQELKDPSSTVHRVFTFSDYVLNPSFPPATFSTRPPTGFTSYSLPSREPQLMVGSPVALGRWQSSRGAVDLDAIGRGKLLIVREQDSLPADALEQFLAQHKLGVETLKLNLGSSGAQYWAPSAPVADALRSGGTPLLILMGGDRKIRAMWLGFDPDAGDALLKEIADAASGKTDE